MELAEAEALRVLHDDQGGVGHIHAHLHHGGGYQYVHVPGGKGGHDGVFLLGTHFTVEQGQTQVGKHLVLEVLGVALHRLQVGEGDRFSLRALLGGAVLHGGTDDVGLPPFAHQFPHKVVHPLPLVLVDHVGLHRGAAWRQLVDDRHVQVSVDDEGQSAGNGGGGHDQHVGGLALGGQGGALGHAEAVLLVGYREPQVMKLHILGDEGVGAHHQVHLPLGNGLAKPLFLGRRERAGEQAHTNSRRLQQGGEGAGVLLGQHLGGGHEGGLHPGLGGQIGPPGGHHRLARAHVALNQPVHGTAGAEVGGHLLHHPALGLGGGEGEQREKFLQRPGGNYPARCVPSTVLEHGKTCGQVEELLKGEPPPGQVQTLRGVGKVDVAEGKFSLGQLVVQAYRTGQRLGHLGGAGLHRRAGERAEQVVGNARRQGVDG